ncbi:hypothetical protein AGMMS50239_02680 [Bacteroidia bacterium]|nr:hypothetical protein AGMMS50239_02680 [Bacteroidia bacterium]
METKNKNIDVLINQCEEHLRKLGYSKACIELHLQKWQQGIKQYMDEHGLSAYNKDTGEQYLRIATNHQAPSTIRCRTHNIHILTEYLECETISKRIVPLASYPLPGEIGDTANLFLQEMNSARRCEQTVQEHRRMLSYFIAGLSLKSKSRIMKDSGVNINKRKFGPHSMRHSLASQLLRNGVSLPVISETLGHEKTQITMEYLRIDLGNLLKCTLDAPVVNPEFYEQKGGVFYE